MSGLTHQQLRTMQFIEDIEDEHGMAPSYDEIQHHLGLASKANIDRLIKGLCERGFISYIPKRARSITILKRVTARPIPTEAEIAKLSGHDLSLLHDRVVREMARWQTEEAIKRADEITARMGGTATGTAGGA